MVNHIDVVGNLTAGNHGFTGGVTGFVGVLLIAGFSFQGTELLGVTAGESENPEKSIPKAMNSIFWRILLFYIFTYYCYLQLLLITKIHACLTLIRQRL